MGDVIQARAIYADDYRAILKDLLSCVDSVHGEMCTGGKEFCGCGANEQEADGLADYIEQLTAERDRARDIAVALEQENARVVHILSTQVIPEADSGSAYFCGVQDGYRTATKHILELLTEPTT